MQSVKEQSLIDSAERIIRNKKTPMDLYELFNVVCAEKEYSEKVKKELITQFYTDLITSAKFVYTGDNTWDLKEFQKTDLREKDGSYYKEYTVIKALDDEVKKPAKAKAKRKTIAKAKPVIEEVKVEEVTPTVEEIVEEVKVIKEDKPKVEVPKSIEEDQVKEYEEEVFEEFEDEFDEEKYNEYMDTYEDKYDEK